MDPAPSPGLRNQMSSYAVGANPPGALVPDTDFARLVAPHRAALQAHCYRMLGSVQDAEDALQETLLRAWRGLPGLKGRGALRAWLAPGRPRGGALPAELAPPSAAHDDLADAPGDVVWLEPYPDAGLAYEA